MDKWMDGSVEGRSEDVEERREGASEREELEGCHFYGRQKQLLC